MSDDQYSKLTKQLADLTDQLGTQILKLYQHMEERFDGIEAMLETKADKSTTNNILQTADGIAAQLETDDHERLAMTSQLDRHESWLKQLAKSTKTKLVPEP